MVGRHADRAGGKPAGGKGSQKGGWLRKSGGRSRAAGDEAYMRELFGELDADGDGEVSLDELRLALMHNPELARLVGAGEGALSPIAAKVIAENLHSLMDEDLSGTVTFAEFCKLCRKLKTLNRSNSIDDGLSPSASEAGNSDTHSRRGERQRTSKIGNGLRKLVRGNEAGAEAQLRALQQALYQSVVLETEEVLQLAESDKRAEERATRYREHLLTVLDRVRGWTADNAFPGAGEPSAETELLRLRHELAESKLQVAQLSGTCEELQHKLHKLSHGSRGDRPLWSKLWDSARPAVH